MVILFGIPWQLPFVMLGLTHGASHATAPLILIGVLHPVGQFFVPLYFMAALSGVRRRIVMKGNLRTSTFQYGIECKEPDCLWATPICTEAGPAYERQEIHSKVTGHRSYELISARSTQLEVL